MSTFASCSWSFVRGLALILSLIALSAAAYAQAPCIDCMTLGLGAPGATTVTAGMLVTPDLTIPASSGDGYFSVPVSGSTAPALPDATYPGWCVTSRFDSSSPTLATFGATSTYQAATLIANGINYILNHKQGRILDVQYAIWTVAGSLSLTQLQNANLLDALAMASGGLSPAGQNFVPAPGQIMGVLLTPSPAVPNEQNFFIEVTNPCGIIGDFVWNDAANSGLQTTAVQGINGVTVQLLDANNNILASTVTGPAPGSYSPLYPAGYYQFTGLCLATYKVNIVNTQPALSGFVPSPTLVGADRTVDSNINSSSITLTTAAPVDETIDFGYYAPPMIVTCAPSSATVNVPYNYRVGVTGGASPFTYAVIGTLPPGVSLNSSSGAISGTPQTSGTYSFTAQVTDSSGMASGIKTSGCTIVVHPPLSAQCAPITTGEQGVFYSSAIAANGGSGSYTYTLIGALPLGLTLNTSTGVISGTATSFGTYSYSVQVTDANNSSLTVTTTSCTLTIAPPPVLTCTAATTASEVGVPFNVPAMTVTGGASPYTFAVVGTLPAGLTLNTTTGAITGTPTAAGSFSLKVTDSNGAVAAGACPFTITGGPVLTCTAATTASEVGVPFNVPAMTVTGGASPYTFAVVGTLPAGLTLNTTSGAITGTPTAAGSFSLKVTDSNGAVAAGACPFTITGGPALTCSAVNSGMVGAAFSAPALTVSGGASPYTFSVVGTLPAGLTLNTTTGAITGTPQAAGSFSIRVTDAQGTSPSTTCAYTITTGGASVSAGDTATIGFWHNKNGQALILSLNGGSTSKSLANWLATNYPYLYGAHGSTNLTNKTNADVAAYFMTLFGVTGQKTYAQILAGALATYVTDSDLAASAAAHYGFNVSSSGTGAKTYNVGMNGTAIGLSNNTSYTVLQLLNQVNVTTQNGTFNANAFNTIFGAINPLGDIV